MKRNFTGWPMVAGAMILLSLCSVGQAQDQVTGQAGALNVSAKIEPFMAVSVTLTQSAEESGGTTGRTRTTGPGSAATTIEFSALEKPGVIDADKDVLVSVASNTAGWSVTCSSQGLSCSEGVIPAERIFVKSDYTNPAADAGVGLGYESLLEPKVVAAGSVAGEVTRPASFKLNITWEDKPGSYDGVLTFTVLPEP